MEEELINSRELFWDTKKRFKMEDLDTWERRWFRENLKGHYHISYSSEFVEIRYYNLFCEIVKFEDERYTIILEGAGPSKYMVAYSFYHVQLFLKQERLINQDAKLISSPPIEKNNENKMINEYFIQSFEVDKDDYNYLRTTERKRPFSENEISDIEDLLKGDKDRLRLINDNRISIIVDVNHVISIRRFSNKYIASATDSLGKIYYAFSNFKSVIELVKSVMKDGQSNRFMKFDDYVLESYNHKLRDLLLNEKVDLKTKLEDILITASEMPDKIKRSWLTHSLSVLIGLYSGPALKSYFDKNPVKDPEVAEVVDDFLEDEVGKIKELEEKLDPTQMKLSQEGWDHIKWEEGDTKKKGEPVLKAYKLGDGRITVGWGHAEPIKKSKFKVGQVITREKAQELLKEDLKTAADGVRRMFSQWKEEGIDIEVTQKQFDVLVSIAFNAGVSGLRNSEIVKHLKEGNIKKAGQSIEDSLTGDWAGLKVRREKEKEMWFS
jgi:GH24 family phage-related lysozyme (muramidase)